MAALVLARLTARRFITSGGSVEAVSFDEVAFVPVLLTVPLDAIIGITLLASLVGSVAVRRNWVKVAFNIGQLSLSTVAGAATYHALSRLFPDDSPSNYVVAGDVAAAIAGTVVIAFVSRSCVVSMIQFVGGEPIAASLKVDRRQATAWLGAAVLGASFSSLALIDYWGLLLALGMAGFVQRAYSAQLLDAISRRSEQRLEYATSQIRGSGSRPAISETLDRSLAELVGAETTAIVSADHKVTGDELAVPLSPDAQIVVSKRRGDAAWTEEDGKTLRTLAAVADDALRRADLFARLTTITDAQNEAVIAFDALGIVSFANPAARQMLRYPLDEQLEGRPVAAVCHLFDRAQPINLTVLLHNAVSVEDSDAVLETTRGQRVEVAYSFAPLTAGDVQDGAVLVLRDVTERRALQEALSHRALHDELTGLPNRRLFTDRLDHALDRSLSNGASHAVMFIDCDRFKLVNDTFGHLIGDQLLVQLSERLLRVARASDTVARLSGDEFILLVEDCSDISRVSELAQHLSEDLRRPYLVDGHTIMLTVSIGVTLTTPGQPREDVMHAADAASYEAKADGRNCVRIATPRLIEATRARLDMESRLRSAISAEQLQLWYQPMVETRTRRLYGVEALVRWEDSDGNIIMPDEFIPIAEDSGLIVTLGRWVLEEACRTVVRWNTEHPDRPALNVSVNLSALQLAQPQLAEEVAGVLAETGLPPSQLCIEITETAVFTDIDANARALAALREIGVLVAVDDFGTGYSSLAYLRQLPVDIVKLDASFIAGLGNDPVDAQIVGSVLRLCKALGRRTVAEGVETEMQWQTLTRMGCPSMQGYLVSRPLRVAAFEEYWAAEQGPDNVRRLGA
jgi:diguanylate cyclase (GGDEF)-like protein/PAS domain S-box-containing protein